MELSAGTAEGTDFSQINTAPINEVMLVQLVTFIVTMPIMTHAVKLDMPNVTNPPPPPPTPPEVIDLEIDFDGTVVWNGSQGSGMPQLESYLDRKSVV